MQALAVRARPGRDRVRRGRAPTATTTFAGSRRRSRSRSAATRRSRARTRCSRPGRAADAVTFHTQSGPLTCTRCRDAHRDGLPGRAADAGRPPPTGCSTRSASTDAVAVLDNKQWYIVEVADAAVVERLTPDLRRLETIVDGASVTARSAPRRRRHRVACLRSRRRRRRGRGHRLGALRAHAVLVRPSSARTELVAYQASARGGTLHCRLAGDRVFLSGPAVTVLRGEVDL